MMCSKISEHVLKARRRWPDVKEHLRVRQVDTAKEEEEEGEEVKELSGPRRRRAGGCVFFFLLFYLAPDREEMHQKRPPESHAAPKTQESRHTGQKRTISFILEK